MLKQYQTQKTAVLLVVLMAALIFATATPGEINQADWPDPVANVVMPYQSSGLTHGPMLGRPTAKTMRIWVRTGEPMEFKVVYSTQLPLTAETAGVVGQTRAEDDNTGFVDLTGLHPNTRYYYGIVINNWLVDTRMDFKPGFPSFMTLPDRTSFRDPTYNPKGLFNFSFATSFGNRQTPDKYGNSPSYSTMFERHGKNLRFFIMNGDYVYEEYRTKENKPYTVDMFRADYKSYLKRGRDMAKFFRHVPTLFTYDDHETYSDLEGTGEIGLKEGKWLYRDLALRPWYEYCGWANFTTGQQYQPIRRSSTRVEKGSDVLYDPSANFNSLRPEAISNIHIQMGSRNAGVYEFVEVIDKNRLRVRPAFTSDEQCAYSVGTHHYYDWKVGNCHFFALDTRGERTRYIPEKAHDPDRFLLGETQRKWLMDGIHSSDSDFVFVISSVSWMIYHTGYHGGERPKPGERSRKEDGFTGAVVERDKLLDFFDRLDKQVIILTGDLHNAFAVQISDNIWEFLLGPINSANHPIGTAGNPPYGGWFDSEGRKVKIKWVAGFPNEVNYTRLRSKYYGVIQVNNVLKSGRQDGPGLHWVAYDQPQVVVQVYDGYTGELVYAEGISMVDARNPAANKSE